MRPIHYIDRLTKKEEEEKVYGKWAIHLAYGDHPFRILFASLLLPLFTKISFFSQLYGWLQKSKRSKKKVLPFIENFGVDTSEFAQRPEEFQSFNDFFIRKLKKEARPIVKGEKVAALFADGRYLFYQDLKKTDGLLVKGQMFSLDDFLRDAALAEKYEGGSMAMARLCPTDYHRFHFPCDCIPEPCRLINGALFSVNPRALEKNIHILTENKRVLTLLKTEHFGDVLYVEIGATYVGSIVQTYKPFVSYKKGDEKGYFSFGGSCIIVLFEKNTIRFDEDLLECSKNRMEVRGLLGQSMGTSIRT